MNTCNVFVPFGALGTGIPREAFTRGVELGPDIIACDAGSTDSGPYYLGTGNGKYAREAVKEDLRLLLRAGAELGIPVAVGSCGTCGTDSGVDEAAQICAELCEEEGLELKLAKIYTQQSPALLRERFAAGEITPLQAAPEIDGDTFDACSNIVALAGAEPFLQALREGTDVILCGRATDTAAIAALPILRGCDEASAWHGAKIAECGALCCTEPMGGVFLRFDEKGLTIQPTLPGNRCTPYSTSAHMLYENADPFALVEPGVTVNVEGASYNQLDEDSVRITGATLQRMPYTMKLEGSSPAGYQTVSLVGIADRRIMCDPLGWISRLEAFVAKRLAAAGMTDGYEYTIKPYGYNAVTGRQIEPGSYIPGELALVLVVTADSQALATKVAKMFNPWLLHFPVNQDEQLPSYAFPFSPSEIERGQIYEFRLNHVVQLSDPLELVRMEYETVGKGDA